MQQSAANNWVKHLRTNGSIYRIDSSTTIRQKQAYSIWIENFVLDFILYQGAKTWPGGNADSGLGIGGTVVKNLTHNCQILYVHKPVGVFTPKKTILGWHHSYVKAADCSQTRQRVISRANQGRWRYNNYKIVWQTCSLVASTSVDSQPVSQVRRWNKQTRRYPTFLPNNSSGPFFISWISQFQTHG